MCSTPLPKLAISLRFGPACSIRAASSAVRDGGHQHVGLAHGGHQFGLRHGAVVDVQPRIEQLAHARLDRVGQLARDDDERLFSARHCFLESGSC